MLDISPEKVARIIIRAREFDAKTAPWDDNTAMVREDESDSILEDTGSDSVSSKLKSYIDDLNVDEQIALVALMWIGRGTYEPDDLAEAVSTARSERVNETSSYLMGVPLLADYLEAGLDKLGYEVTDIEDDVM